MVLSSRAFAFHRVRGLVLENPQPQPQTESYVKFFIGADAMHGSLGNPAGAPSFARIGPESFARIGPESFARIRCAWKGLEPRGS